ERHAAAVLLLLMSFVLFFSSFLAGGVQAQEKDLKKEIAEVLKAPEFGHYRDAMRWQPRDPAKPKEAKPADTTVWNAIGYALAKAAEVLLWAVAIAAAAYALWWLARRLPRSAQRPREAY